MKRILITGANSGLGLQLAKDYAASGWQVVACGRDSEKLQQALAGIEVESCVFDMQQPEDIQAAVAQIAPLDMVLLNAGNCEYIEDALHFDGALFARVVNVNLIGTANCVAALVGHIKPGGRLAVVSSSVSFLPLTRSEAYGASKAGLDYLVRTLAIDLTPHQIAVSLIRPGFVDTPLTEGNPFPMPALVTPQDAAKAIVKGWERGAFEIDFPRRFTLVMKLLRLLPYSVYFPLVRKMTGMG